MQTAGDLETRLRANEKGKEKTESKCAERNEGCNKVWTHEIQSRNAIMFSCGCFCVIFCKKYIL